VGGWILFVPKTCWAKQITLDVFGAIDKAQHKDVPDQQRLILAR